MSIIADIERALSIYDKKLLGDPGVSFRFDFVSFRYRIFYSNPEVTPLITCELNSESLSIDLKLQLIRMNRRRLKQAKKKACTTSNVIDITKTFLNQNDFDEQRIFAYEESGDRLLDLMLDEKCVFGILTPQSDNLNEILTYFPDFTDDSNCFKGPRIDPDDIFFNVDPKMIVRKLLTSETGSILISIPIEDIESKNAFFNDGMLKYAYVKSYMLPANMYSKGTKYLGEMLDEESIERKLSEERLEELKLAREKKPTN